MRQPEAGGKKAPTASQERYRALLVIGAAAATTWAIQEVWLKYQAGPGLRRCATSDAADYREAHLPPTDDVWEAPGCKPPAVNHSSLEWHRCEIRRDLCIDQGRIISWAPEWRPGHPDFGKQAPWRFDNAPTATPGHPDLYQMEGGFQVHYCQPQLKFRPAAIEPGAEQPDVEAPRWSQCTMPVLFWPYWMMNVGEVYMDTILPLAEMYHGDHPLFLDRRASLTPVLDSFRPPSWYNWLLYPFSDRKVEELSELSARTHAGDVRRSRCFRQVMFCALYNAQSLRPGKVWSTMEAVRAEQRPAATGQRIASFYRQRFPKAFYKANKKVLQVLIIYRPHGSRRMLNLEQVLALCNAYVPAAGPAKRTNCEVIEFKEGHFLEELALLQRADVLVGLHGAPLIYGLLMRPGSAVIEIRPRGFEGDWPNTYSQTTYNLDRIIRFFYLATSEHNWQPSHLEKLGIGSQRDRNTIVDWDKLRRVLEDVVSGKPGYSKAQYQQDSPHYKDVEE